MDLATATLAGAGISAASGLIGNLFNTDTINETNKRNYETSKEFAQNSIQWRVADANKAGIHPLAALGMQSAYAPSAMASTSDFGNAIAGAGQATARAMEQLARLNLEEKQLDLEGKKLDNEAKAAALATPKAEDITKTAGGFAIQQVNNPANVLWSEKTAPAYQLEPVVSGYQKITPREGSMESERRSESLIASYLGGFGDISHAISEARELNKRDPKARWEPVPELSTGSIALVNTNDPVAMQNLSLYQKTGVKLGKFFRWLGLPDSYR